MSVKSISDRVVRGTKRHLPAILTGLGVAGMLGSTVLAVRATPEALRQIYDAESETTEDISTKEKIKLTWRYYIPAAASGLLGATAAIGAQAVNSKRHGALIALYATSEATLVKYQEKLVEQLGDKAAEKVRGAVAEEVIKSRTDDPIIKTKESYSVEPVKFIDGITGRSFYSDLQSVRKAVNDVNEQIDKFNTASQNSFYALLGLPPVQLGDDWGWNVDQRLEVAYQTGTDEHDVPCFMIEYLSRPISGYWSGY